MFNFDSIPTSPISVDDVRANGAFWLKKLKPSSFDVNLDFSEMFFSFDKSKVFGEENEFLSASTVGFLDGYDEREEISFYGINSKGSLANKGNSFQVDSVFDFDYTSMFRPYFFTLDFTAVFKADATGTHRGVRLKVEIQPQNTVGSMEDLARDLPSPFENYDLSGMDFEHEYDREHFVEQKLLHAGEFYRVLANSMEVVDKFYRVVPTDFLLLEGKNPRRMEPIFSICSTSDIYDVANRKFCVAVNTEGKDLEYIVGETPGRTTTVLA